MTALYREWDFLQGFYGMWPHSIINNALCKFFFIHWSYRGIANIN
jgi:hypothetical protein